MALISTSLFTKELFDKWVNAFIIVPPTYRRDGSIAVTAYVNLI